MFYMVLLEFLAQRTAVDTEVGRGLRLVVIAMPQNRLEHGLFDFRNNRVEQVTG
jgi:hypothetical protein